MAEHTKHTPGPWSVDPADPFLITADCDGCMVAETDNDDRQDDGEAQANARLIAAAPELLAAAIRLMAGTGLTPHDCPCGCCVCEMAKVIANAEGGAA